MATMFINPTETNSLNLQKFKRKPKINGSSLKSFWAFLLSLVLYISVFYAFNLSASTLLCTTKFWFFISNTLIFIIAADFGAFSSSKEADFYQEYSNPVRPTHPFHPKYVENIATGNHDQEQQDYEKPREKIINIMCGSTTENDSRIENHEPDVEEKHAHYTENPSQIIPQVKNKAHALKKRSKAVSFRRNSAKEILSKIDVADKLVVKRTLSAGHEEPPPPRCEANDEYSRMSDEELNRRVEDFIRKFNRQIRLQASKSPQI